MITWPSIFPAPYVKYSVAAEPTVNRSDNEDLFVLQTPKSRLERRIVSVQWTMTASQAALFQSWVRFKLCLGQSRFKITLPIDGVELEREALLQDGVYNLTRDDSQFKVDAKLIVQLEVQHA